MRIKRTKCGCNFGETSVLKCIENVVYVYLKKRKNVQHYY